jgi:hypothetical protein
MAKGKRSSGKARSAISGRYVTKATGANRKGRRSGRVGGNSRPKYSGAHRGKLLWSLLRPRLRPWSRESMESWVYVSR